MNELTLECMMNPALYDKFKHVQQPNKRKQREEDVQKYKDKIIHTTKLLFDNKSKNDTLNAAFNHFVDECIYTYKSKELHNKPLPETAPHCNDVSFNYVFQEHNKTITLHKFVKVKEKDKKIDNINI